MTINPSLVDAVSNTKQATVLATLGLPLQQPGVFIVYDKDHPKSSGGTAYFLFQSSIGNVVQKTLRTYDEGTADAELDDFLALSKGQSTDLDAFIEELIPKIRDALIVNGRKFLDNYQVIVKSLKTDIAKYVMTGGTPVIGKDGKIAGIQQFTLKGVKE